MDPRSGFDKNFSVGWVAATGPGHSQGGRTGHGVWGEARPQPGIGGAGAPQDKARGMVGGSPPRPRAFLKLPYSGLRKGHYRAQSKGPYGALLERPYKGPYNVFLKGPYVFFKVPYRALAVHLAKRSACGSRTSRAPAPRCRKLRRRSTLCAIAADGKGPWLGGPPANPLKFVFQNPKRPLPSGKPIS